MEPDWERFGVLKSIQHANQSSRSAEEIKKEIKRLNAKIDAERRERKQEQERLNSRPQCPYCGNRLEGQFELCNACSKPIIWVHGQVGKPGTEAILEAEWQKEQERKRVNAEQQRVHRIAQAKAARHQRAKVELDTLREAVSNEGFNTWLGIGLTLIVLFGVALLCRDIYGSFSDFFRWPGVVVSLVFVPLCMLQVERHKKALKALEQAIGSKERHEKAAKKLEEVAAKKPSSDDDSQSSFLDRLTELSHATAKILSMHKGDLNLSGLTQISDAAAESLGSHVGTLCLNGLTELSDNAAESLSRHTGNTLNLNGLTELSDTATGHLAKLPNLTINLDALPASAAQILRDAGHG